MVQLSTGMHACHLRLQSSLAYQITIIYYNNVNICSEIKQICAFPRVL